MKNFLHRLTFLKIAQVFLMAFLLTFPFQIRSLIYSLPLYGSGEFDFYTSFFLYLSDICFFGAFLFWAVSLCQKKNEFQLSLGDEMLTFILLAMLLVMVGNIFFAAEKELHFFLTFRFFELFLLYLMIVNGVLRQQQIIFCLLLSLSAQSLIAIYQYFLQSSIGLNFLGEAQVNASTLGVAKIDLGSQKILRAFGTMPHANVLGGLLFMGVVYAGFLVQKYRWFMLSIVGLMVMALLFTFSRSAFFALIAALLLYVSVKNSKIALRYVLLALTLLVFFIVVFRLQNVFFLRFLFEDSAAMQERTMYLKIGRDMFIDQPWGVGLGGFTVLMQNYTPLKLVPWLFQPVHSIFILVFTELGAAGGLAFCSIFVYSFYKLIIFLRQQKKSEQKNPALLLALLAGIAVIGLFDHYFMTIYQAQVMLFIYLAFVSGLLSSERLPIKNS